MKRLSFLVFFLIASAAVATWCTPRPGRPEPAREFHTNPEQARVVMETVGGPSEGSPEEKAALAKIREKEEAERAAARSAAADAKWSREEVLKKFAHSLAHTVNENHLETAKRLGKTAVKDFYNELYVEIYRRLDAETIGLEGQAFAAKAKEVGGAWATKKMLGN